MGRFIIKWCDTSVTLMLCAAGKKVKTSVCADRGYDLELAGFLPICIVYCWLDYVNLTCKHACWEII